MVQTMNTFLSAGDKFMPKMQLSQSRFAYNAYGLLREKKKEKQEKRQKLKETWDFNYIYQNESNKACFQNGIVHGHYKSLAYRTVSNKIFMW